MITPPAALLMMTTGARWTVQWQLQVQNREQTGNKGTSGMQCLCKQGMRQMAMQGDRIELRFDGGMHSYGRRMDQDHCNDWADHGKN